MSVVLVALVLPMLALPAQVQAQEWSAEQLEVWDAVNTLWDLEMRGDPAWPDMLHDSFIGWVDESPAPHDKGTTVRFINAEADQLRWVVHDLKPVGIVVTGNTAVVHYFHVAIIEYRDGDRDTVYGRQTDVLTRTGDGWRYVSWLGHERSDEEGDDLDF
jgi:hypothetical protein